MEMTLIVIIPKCSNASDWQDISRMLGIVTNLRSVNSGGSLIQKLLMAYYHFTGFARATCCCYDGSEMIEGLGNQFFGKKKLDYHQITNSSRSV